MCTNGSIPGVKWPEREFKTPTCIYCQGQECMELNLQSVIRLHGLLEEKLTLTVLYGQHI